MHSIRAIDGPVEFSLSWWAHWDYKMTMDEYDPWLSLRFRVPAKNNESMPVGGSDFHFDLDTRGFTIHPTTRWIRAPRLHSNWVTKTTATTFHYFSSCGVSTEDKKAFSRPIFSFVFFFLFTPIIGLRCRACSSFLFFFGASLNTNPMKNCAITSPALDRFGDLL